MCLHYKRRSRSYNGRRRSTNKSAIAKCAVLKRRRPTRQRSTHKPELAKHADLTVTVSRRQAANAKRYALATPPHELDIRSPERLSRRRLTSVDKLRRFLRIVTSSTSVVQQTWATMLMNFTNRNVVETACQTRNVSTDQLYREYVSAIVGAARAADGEVDAVESTSRCTHRSRFGMRCVKDPSPDKHHSYTPPDMCPAQFQRLLDLIVTRTSTPRQGLEPLWLIAATATWRRGSG